MHRGVCPRVGIAALLVGLPLLPAMGWAQLAPSPDAPPVSNAPAPPPDETPIDNLQGECEPGRPVLHGQGQERATRSASDDATSASVAEDKAPQTFKSFVARDRPAADAGNSAGHLGQPATSAAAGAAGGQPVSWSRCCAQKDEAFLASFDVNVDLLQDFTNSPHTAVARHGQSADQCRRRIARPSRAWAAGRSRQQSQGHGAV